MTKHGADSIVSERFFTGGYGFYLSIFPEDYSKVITPTMPTSEEARTAMNLMRLWAGVEHCNTGRMARSGEMPPQPGKSLPLTIQAM